MVLCAPSIGCFVLLTPQPEFLLSSPAFTAPASHRIRTFVYSWGSCTNTFCAQRASLVRLVLLRRSRWIWIHAHARRAHNSLRVPHENMASESMRLVTPQRVFGLESQAWTHKSTTNHQPWWVSIITLILQSKSAIVPILTIKQFGKSFDLFKNASNSI